MTVQHIKDTQYIKAPSWHGGKFVDPTAQSFWSQLPDLLRSIAVEEIKSGNKIEQILFNESRGIVLLAFEEGPLTPRPSDPDITIHTKHSYGNYCYDGILCTYEERSTGCFLAFDDPGYVEEAL